MAATIIKANPGFYVAYFSPVDELKYEPILAWRIIEYETGEDADCFPISISGSFFAMWYAIKTPDDKYFVFGEEKELCSLKDDFVAYWKERGA